MKVGIIGVTGNAGAELARYLLKHPEFELAEVSGRSEAGKKLADVFPYLHQYDLTIEPEIGSADLFFSALPHKSSAEICGPLVKRGKKVVDLSADFRLSDRAVYEQTYEVTHPHPEMLETAVYGLPELRRPEVAQTRLVGNPGCYPTAAILALAPAICAGIASPKVIIDAKSGVSGAGRTPTMATNYIEINENTHAYSVAGHRHEPEIVQELDRLRPRGLKPIDTTFIPHLVPMTRGILANCYTPAIQHTSQAQVDELYREFYRDKPFVEVVNRPPETKWTYGNNMVYVMPHFHERSGNLVLMAVEDNLGKGAAGQAIQNANLMCGFPENLGLDTGAVYP
ncbi:MAG TPA: N-acetyl-gamma-glutamyl-phosphate reductase [Chloroflexota bacterium]|nr:N-acetyl-gamma-glutamyl-phosphate reductase [Chloroflexota bacterium]